MLKWFQVISNSYSSTLSYSGNYYYFTKCLHLLYYIARYNVLYLNIYIAKRSDYNLLWTIINFRADSLISYFQIQSTDGTFKEVSQSTMEGWNPWLGIWVNKWMSDTDVTLDFKDQLCHLWYNCFNGSLNIRFSLHTERENTTFE